jgi:hypothetical protein
MRQKIRDNPFAIEKYSKEELAAYDEWIMAHLDRKLLKSLENAYKYSEDEYAQRWSTLYPYRYWNMLHNRQVDEKRAFVLKAAATVGTVAAAALANSLLEAEEDEEADK